MKSEHTGFGEFPWQDLLLAVRRRLRWAALVRGASLTVGTIAGFLLAGVGLDFLFFWKPESRLVYGGLACAVVLIFARRVLWRPLAAPLSDFEIVALLERRIGSLQERLAAAHQLWTSPPAAGSLEAGRRFLAALKHEGLPLDRASVDSLFSRRAVMAPALTLGSLALLVLILAAASPLFRTGLSRWVPGAGARWTRLSVDPPPAVAGQDELIVVSGTVEGRVPSGALLRLTEGVGSSAGEKSQEEHWLPIENGAFQHRLEGRTASFCLQVLTGDAASEIYAVRVLRRPALIAVRVELAPPVYARQEPRRQEHGDITAMVGTRVTVSCGADQELLRGELVMSTGERFPLSPGTQEGEPEWKGMFVLTEGMESYTILLTGIDGLTNEPPPVYRICAIPDRPPAVEWLRPTRAEIKATPQAVLRLGYRADDDTRVVAVRLSAAGIPESGPGKGWALGLGPGPEQSAAFDLSVMAGREGDLFECRLEAVDEREPHPNRTLSRPMRIRLASTAEMCSEIDADLSRLREAADEAYDKWLAADVALAHLADGKDAAAVGARQRDAARICREGFAALREVGLRIEENRLGDHYPEAVLARAEEVWGEVLNQAIPQAMKGEFREGAAARVDASRRVLTGLAEVRRLFLEWEDFSGVVRLAGRSIRAQEDVLRAIQKEAGAPSESR